MIGSQFLSLRQPVRLQHFPLTSATTEIPIKDRRFERKMRALIAGYTFVLTSLRMARMRRMVATSRSNSIGLVSNSSQPAAIAFSRSPASA